MKLTEKQLLTLYRGGYKLPQILAILFLRDEGQATMRAIAEHLGVSTAAGTGIIDRLTARDLTERINSGSDRRVVFVSLTPRGEKFVDGLKPKATAIKAPKKITTPVSK